VLQLYVGRECSEMEPIVLSSKSIQVVCISDTHNDNCLPYIPPGDIFIHAGDFTDNGTDEELQAAYNWISILPHEVKVIVAGESTGHKQHNLSCLVLKHRIDKTFTGNHDLGLDRAHPNFSAKALALFTSPEAQACGIHYLDRETRVVAQYYSSNHQLLPIRVYGNPTQPDFLNSSYAFTYKPYPSEGATAAWTTAPQSSKSLDIWVTHGPPKDRLDAINIPGLIGCEVLARAIAKARPLLCVFGHYHYSWGIERVRWQSNRDEVAEAHSLLKSEMPNEYDFTNSGFLGPIQPHKETLFVNAAWMTMEKTAIVHRNPPFVLKLKPPSDGRPNIGIAI
jgi:hypothetical protein